ncbi:MAG: inositol-3-phosphate synthase, partial [Bacteroidales bacterium]|nr:inositol-3-phosphate synthase [Bacteroidales bacterium]
GLGAVSTTFMTGVLMVRKGLGKPVGSMTQYDKIRVGRGADKKYLHYKDIVPLADLNDIVFSAWDVYPVNAYESACNAQVLQPKDIEPVKDELVNIKPLKAAFDKNYAKRLDGNNVKDCKDRWDMAQQIREDIRNFKKETGVDRVVVLWAASTEIYVAPDMKYHGTLAALEAAMKANDTVHIAPSMCYAYAALQEDAPFIMGAPNTTVDIPAMWELAEEKKLPIAGKDFKTGQTLVKSGFAPIIGTRCLGLNGWFSTNILGNRDGLVLDEPANFHTKEVSKLSTLESILVADKQPDLYSNYYHKVRINYYPPRNDNKEGWDNIDIFGWLGYPMQIKINFLCRDSILAAPLCLDLTLLMDLAHRAGRYGIQRFLSFFLKAPMHDYTKDEVPVNHLFQQYVMLKNALREMGGYEADEEID